MEPEFLDPGPDQPVPLPGYPPPPAYPAPGAGSQPSGAGSPPSAVPPPGYAPLGYPAPGGATAARPAGRRETTGLLVMLVAATALPLFAATQTVYSVVEQNVVARESFAVSAWGDYDVSAGQPLAGHAPRFGVLLVLAAAGFGLLALLAVRQLLARGAAHSPAARTSLGIAAAATGLVGLQVGVTAAMTLQLQSAFSAYQEASGVLEVRLRVGPAIWLALVGVVAGALSVLAALRVRHAFQEAGSGY